MKQYIITEEDLCTIRDYILGAFYEGENKEKMYDHIKAEFSVIRSHPYQSERDDEDCIYEGLADDSLPTVKVALSCYLGKRIRVSIEDLRAGEP